LCRPAVRRGEVAHRVQAQLSPLISSDVCGRAAARCFVLGSLWVLLVSMSRDAAKNCKQCGKAYVIAGTEARFFLSRNLTLPARCPRCRAEAKTLRRQDRAPPPARAIDRDIPLPAIPIPPDAPVHDPRPHLVSLERPQQFDFYSRHPEWGNAALSGWRGEDGGRWTGGHPQWAAWGEQEWRGEASPRDWRVSSACRQVGTRPRGEERECKRIRR
jgi:hypothetical protein